MVISTDHTDEPLHFSALLHSASELHEATHTCVEGKHPIHINIDHRLMELGGDVSWHPCVYTDYLVKARDFEYSFWILPLRRGQVVEDVVYDNSLKMKV